VKSSVIVSTYNRPHYLERVIEGFLNQKILPTEIIVADDGSKDETGLLVRQYAGRSPVAIKHVWHPDEGFRAAAIRNRAAARSEGEYLIFTDDDCVPCSRFVEDHLSLAEHGCFIQGHRVLLGEHASDGFSFRKISAPGLFLMGLKKDASNVINAVRLPFPMIRKSESMRGIRSCNMSMFGKDFFSVNESMRGIRSCNMSMFGKDFFSVNGFNEDFLGWGKEDSELVARLYKLGVKRKDVKFRACCFHLFHELYDRGNVDRNIALLQESIKKVEHYCKNGVDKYLNNE